MFWTVHVMYGSWMLLGGSWDSGNFESFLSPRSVQGCRRLIGRCACGGRLVVVVIQGFMFGFCACLEDSFLYCWGEHFRGLVDRLGRAVLRITNLHRSEVSAEAWVSQIQFRTWCFKLEVSVWDGIPGASLAGAFYWASVSLHRSVKCHVQPATSCNVCGWFYVIVTMSRECWSFACKPALLITLIVCAVHRNCSWRESRLYCVDSQPVRKVEIQVIDWL
jgi:hypothetical protein